MQSPRRVKASVLQAASDQVNNPSFLRARRECAATKVQWLGAIQTVVTEVKASLWTSITRSRRSRSSRSGGMVSRSHSCRRTARRTRSLRPQMTKENPVNPDPLYPRNRGYRFEGYQLDADGVPTFLYRTGAVSVADRSHAAVSNRLNGLVRTL